MSFAGILRQSTAVDVLIGPFVDSTDGDAEETALTIAQADVRLSKNGQAAAQKSDVTTCAHDADGFYNCELDATDTDTVGQLTLYVHVAGALAVRHDFQVVEEAVYDQLFAASAPGAASTTSAAAIEADTQDIQARLPAALVGGRIDATVDGTGLEAGAAAVIADAVWDEAQAGHTTAGTFGELATEIAAILVDTAEIGAAGAGLTAIPWNAAWDAEVQSEVQDALEANHLDHLLAVTYDPASKPGAADALLNELVESDAGVSRFTANALEQGPGGGSAPTAADIADAVWQEAIADHSGTVGSTAEALAAILVDTAVIGAAGAGLTAIPWNAAWDAEVQSEAADALIAYDPPTNAEFEARTLVAASYFDPATDGVNVTRINGTTLTGDGSAGTPWGPV